MPAAEEAADSRRGATKSLVCVAKRFTLASARARRSEPADGGIPSTAPAAAAAARGGAADAGAVEVGASESGRAAGGGRAGRGGGAPGAGMRARSSCGLGVAQRGQRRRDDSERSARG